MRMSASVFIALIVTLGFGAGANAKAISAKQRFGPTEHISGTFYSTFENAIFTTCPWSAPNCTDEGEAYTLSCAENACSVLEDAIHAADSSPPTLNVDLKVELIGKRELRKGPSKYLGDPGRTIQVQHVEWAAPLRHSP
jgi:hypothetical protein